MRWIVGIDQRDRSRGAIEMAAWLHDHDHTPERQELYGLQVIDDHFREPLSADAHAQLSELARHAAARTIAAIGGPSPFTELHVEFGAPVEDALERYADVIGAEALLIGRIGVREVTGITRLGRVARRLLRGSPRPVVVVPPDLRRTSIGAGAIVLATDLGASSVAAARFARRLATATGRELVVVHVDATIEHEHSELVDVVRPALADVVAWTRQQELEPTRVRLVRADVLDAVLAVAVEEHSPLVVAGSRRLSLGERIFGSSIGTDLGRVADRAVAIVPPG